MRWKRPLSPGPLRDGLILALLILLALLFLVDQASLRLAADDVAWLHGGAPTVFDRYRLLPRLFFIALHALVGPEAGAALALLFGFHALNGLLVYALGRRLLEERLAALVAAGVVLINPLTLGTLTWVSCLSYVQGTTAALLALLAADRFLRQGGGGWALAALLAFGAGLFCSHEILFLPALFVVLGWFRAGQHVLRRTARDETPNRSRRTTVRRRGADCDPRRAEGWFRGRLRAGAALGAAGAALAWAVNAFVYDFGRYGVEAGRLLSFDFALAYISTLFSAGLVLALAYPLSFFAHPLDFLRLGFGEPLRWAMTWLLLGLGAILYRRDRRRRLDLTLALAFAVLISPYIIRLYLTPEGVNYHISYALSGRVFYLPFSLLALALGELTARLVRPLRKWKGVGWLLLLPLAAYVHALRLYDPADFLGLNVVHETPARPPPPRWNPYAAQQPAWLWPTLIALALLAFARRRSRSRPHPR